MSEQSVTVLAKADEENGCEACWDAARAAGVEDVPGSQLLVRAPAEWVGRPCPHDAPSYAPSILVAAEAQGSFNEHGHWIPAPTGPDCDRCGGHGTIRAEDGGPAEDCPDCSGAAEHADDLGLECARCGQALRDDVLRMLDDGGPEQCSRCGLVLPPIPDEWLAGNGYEVEVE